jgi:predicted enzyme related to lactoylglutathione lyase
MVHVPDPREGLAWYERAFPLARRVTLDDQGFECLRLGPVQIEVVPSDEKVSHGPSGSVVYWWVNHLPNTLAHLEGVGAKLYRGPLRIEGGLSMCQVQDPWGNCIGLRGPEL